MRRIGTIFEKEWVQYQADDSVERELVGHFDNGLADGGRTGLFIVLIEQFLHYALLGHLVTLYK